MNATAVLLLALIGSALLAGRVLWSKRARRATAAIAAMTDDGPSADLNPNPVLDVDEAGNVIAANPVAKHWLHQAGLDPQRLALYAPPELPALFATWDRQQERTYLRDLTLGDRLLHETIVFAPQLPGARIYVADVTARHQAEEALRASERRFTDLIEALPQLVWISDAANNTRYVSAAWSRYAGRPMATAEDRRAIVHPDDAPQALAAWDQARRAGERGEIELRLRRHDGVYRWFRCDVVPSRDDAGRVTEWTATCTEIHELKELQESLRANEQRLRPHVEHSPLAVIEWSPDLAITHWTGEAERIFGWSAQETFGKSLQSLNMVYEDDLPLVTEMSVRLRAGADRVSVCSRNYTKDGRVLHCEWYNSTLLDPAGNIALIKSLVLDVTERKCAEQALDEARRRLSTIVDSIADGFYVLDRHWRFTHVNDAALRHWGLTLDRMLHRTIFEVFPDFAGSPFHAAFQSAMDSGQPFHLESPSVVLDARVIELFGYPGVDVLTLLFRDVTARVTTEAALRASEEKYRTLFNAMTEGFLLHRARYDSRGRLIDLELVDANPSAVAARDGGRSKQGMRNDDWRELWPAREQRWEMARRVMEGGEDVHWEHYETTTQRWFDAHAFRISRELLGVVFADVTERRRAQQRVLDLNADLLRQNIRLGDLNQELESFVYSVSHDLRAPLRAMSSFATLLQEDHAPSLDAHGRDYLERIRRSAERMSARIDALLHLARISRQEVQRQSMDLSPLAAAVVAELRDADPQRRVEVSITPQLPADADPSLIAVALSNLIGNAWKFTRHAAHPRIEVGARREGGRIVYYVRDNGAGFDPAFAAQLFRPFHRLHTEPEFEGTGLGLAIAARVIRSHGGEIWADGAREKGAHFRFTL